MKPNLAIFRKKAKYYLLWLWRKDAIIFLLFVGLASIFWWGRVMSSSRDMNIKLPVTYTGIPNEVSFNRELPTTLIITVRDEGKQLRQLSHQDIVLNLNLSSFLHDKQGEVKLTADMLRPRIQDLLPGSTNIQHITPEEIQFSYDSENMKKVGVKIKAEVSAAEQYQLVGGAKIIPDTVQIFGSKDAIDSIQYILTDSIHIHNLRDSISLEVKLIAPNGIRVKPQTISVSWLAEQFTEKSFVLPIEVENTTAGEKLRLFPQTAEVIIRVCVSEFSNIQASDLQVVCQYPLEETKSLPLEIKTSNPHIYNTRISPSSVEYIIER